MAVNQIYFLLFGDRIPIFNQLPNTQNSLLQQQQQQNEKISMNLTEKLLLGILFASSLTFVVIADEENGKFICCAFKHFFSCKN